MKRKYLFLLFLLLQLHAAYSQNKPGKIISASSGSKRVNTFPFFEIKEEEEKKPGKEKIVSKPETEIAENQTKTKKETAKKEPDKKKGKPSKDTTPPPPKKLDFKKPEETAKAVVEPEALKIIYFDAKEIKTNKKDNAYFYRQARFDRSSGQPRGTVTDYYANGDKLKFEGQFRKYEGLYEERNKDYDGKCKFYEEDGSFVLRNYSNKRITEETKFNADKQVVGQTEYGLNGKKKKFSEYILDKNGKRIGTIQGNFNPKTGLEEAVKELNYENGKLKSVVEMVSNCPKSKAVYYTEEGVRYDAYFQDFSCEPNGQWKFSNKSYFQTTHKISPNGYKISTVTNKQEGILHMPVAYDFYNKPFEIVAVFDLSGVRPMNEFGIVWEFQDYRNYSYMKINYTTKVFEVNAVRDGITQNYMVGIKPQILDLGNKEVKVSFKKSDSGRIFSFNDDPLKFTKTNNQTASFDKFARIGEKDFKIWGIGFYFKSNIINESIILKSLDVKLL